MSESIPPPVPSVAPPAPGVPPNDLAHGATEHGGPSSSREMAFIMDVPVELSVEIGRKTMKLGEILNLGPGAVLELDKLNGEPLDLYANDRLVARGEAVVIGERYGIRLKEVLVTEPHK